VALARQRPRLTGRRPDRPVIHNADMATERLTAQRASASAEPGRSLLRAMGAELDALYGSEEVLSGAPADFAGPGDAFLVVSDGGRPVACGGIKRLDDRTGEIKRMYVVPEARGRGVARALLGFLEGTARELGYTRVRLDTGDRQPHARALYVSARYAPIDDYNANPAASFWFEKAL